jgi:hypothetical protein
MTQPIDYNTPNTPLDFRNRKGGLITFGIMLIVLGSCAACVSLMTPLSLFALPSQNDSLRIRSLISALMIYIAAAVGLIWTGIGSVQARRWVRPVVLIYATIGLVIGAITTITLAFTWPTLKATVLASQQSRGRPLPSGFFFAGGIAAILIILILYIFVPAIFLWFYRDDDVRRTLEFYDPNRRWTDERPLPLLGLSLGSATFAFSCLISSIYGVAAFFGIFLTGIAGTAMLLAYAALFFIAAILIYRFSITGWRIVILAMALFAISTVITYARNDVPNLALVSGAPREMELNALMRRAISIPTAAMMLGGIGYAIWTRKFFNQTELK